MYDSEDIIHEIFILLKGCSIGYVTDENFEQVCITHAKLLCHIDSDFSFLLQVDPTRDRIREAEAFVFDSMKTWHKIGLSVKPKAHILKTMQYSPCKLLMVLMVRPIFF